MTELIFNLALLLAFFVVVVTVTVGSLRRRRADRRRQDDERSLILQAFVGAATQPTTPSTPHLTAQSDVPPAAAVPTPARQRHQLDVESVAALLDLLEGRQPARRGLVSGLISSPRTIWSAGETAGRQAGQRTMAGIRSRPADDISVQLYREAAAELVQIYSQNPRDAHEQYQRYAAVLGDPVLAELYVRSAAYAVHPYNPSHLATVVDEITRSVLAQEVSDAGDIVEP